MSDSKRPTDSNLITREYFDSLLIEMRHIGAVIPDTKFSLYGHEFSTPVMMAALSHLDKCHEDGMVEMARGAKAAGSVMWAGMGGEAELERITATGAKTVKIIKPYADNGYILQRIKHAEDCGCIAVGMDIDHAYNGRGEYDVILGKEMKGKTLEEIKMFAASTKLPFILKGVLSVSEAKLCMNAGLQGIVVSHHHGIIDSAVPPLMVLPEIAKAVGGRMPIFVDCGVSDGPDVFKAMALGATAVSVGRTIMDALTENGGEGVKNKVREITARLAGLMAKTCTKDLNSFDSSVIWEKNSYRR